ncbi:MAG TPA: hypothetical protein VM791_07050 [Vicinamibacterales bacterium]|nr:hypothetical protein [Vicinamibacterales bacterium]
MRSANDRGAALLIAITLVLIVVAIAAAVSVTSRTETLIAASFREGKEMLYAAEGAIALAVRDLDAAADWNQVLSGAASSFTDGASIGSRSLPGGVTITLCCGTGSVSDDVQQRAHGGRDWGADTPQWKMFAWGPAADWLPAGRLFTPVYVAVWVGDDPADGDGNPVLDANGILLLHAVALGVSGGRRAVEAVVQRPAATGLPPPPGLRILSWQAVRW